MEAKHKLDDYSTGQNWIFKLSVIIVIFLNKKKINLINFKIINQYKDPEPNFDKSKVKGRIFTLFKTIDNKLLKAIEQGAG